MRLQDITRFVPAEVRRDGEFVALGTLRHDRAGMLVYVAGREFLPLLLANPNVSCAVTAAELAGEVPGSCGVAVAEDPVTAFFELHNRLAAETDFYGQDSPTEVSPGARVHPAAHVAERGVRIEGGAVIEARAAVLEGSTVGEGAVVRAGAVLGAQGFGFVPSGRGVLPVTHTGGVRLHERVELQSNASVDRALLGGLTEIGEDTKVGNLVYVGHHTRIGRRCLIGAAAALAGSVTVGDDVRIGPNATVRNEVTIGDGARVSLGSVVTRDVPAGQRVTGNFAVDHERFITRLKSAR
jgi:UDP-3-O-[3-hydroxymyristoyl] glucosamine N-acyltransferase